MERTNPVTGKTPPEGRGRSLDDCGRLHVPMQDHTSEPVSTAREESENIQDNDRETAVPDVIVSASPDDPERDSQIQDFASKLELISDAVGRMLDLGDSEMLEAITRQLKSAAMGHGFSQIAEAAAGVEHAVRTGADQDSLSNRVHTLRVMCSRA